MQTKHRLHPVWIFVTFILLFGMSCSLFGGGAETPGTEEEQLPPLVPTTEGIFPEELPILLIPLVPDAANFSSSQESFSYTTQLSIEEVASFYEENLPAQGWTIEEQGNMGTTLLWTISQQDMTYLLTIMPSNGMTIVTAGQLK